MKLKLLTILCFFSFIYISSAQNYPGGVTGAEVWYMGEKDGIQNGQFVNAAQTDIEIKQCGEAEYDLFNFNASIFSEKLCLEYNAPLENTTGRNVFFVGAPYKRKPSFSHLGTVSNRGAENSLQTDSIVRNFFNFNNRNVYGTEIFTDYNSNKRAHLNFYHSNHYNIDKKFKSYGKEGESTFYIGRETSIDPEVEFEDLDFHGNFPEFVSFAREISDNERNRVESYLALKYGLTLNRRTSYLNSKNIVFWEWINNKKFGNRIFGFGRDDISRLNQLQSESTHLKNHLVSAIDKIMETNMEKQESIRIQNDHFLVFGDNNGKPDFVNENNKHIRFWGKVWLAQRTGKATHEFSTHHKLFLDDQLITVLQEEPRLKLWLMQDKYVGNDEVSEFDSEHIEYYPADVNFDQGYAYFKDVFFDSDLSVYDQFTFGVGPEMIVQAQVKGCERDRLELVVDITGGRPEYHIVVESDAGTFEASTDENTYSFPAISGTTYYITVYDAQGLVSEVEITIEPWGFSLNLGPDQYLSNAQPEIILDAGVGIDDPDATYSWYLNDVLLPDTQSVLTISEPGYYAVEVISGDLSCTIKDDIKILNSELEVHITIEDACADENYGSIFIEIDGGVAPFFTTLESADSTTNYAHNETTTISDIEFGVYIITITDSAGEVFTTDFEISAPLVGLDIYAQLEAYCNPNFNCLYDYLPETPLFNPGGLIDFSLDASVGINNNNMSYEWQIDGVDLDTNSPLIYFQVGSDCYENVIPVFTVIATDNETGCSQTQSFAARGVCPVRGQQNRTTGSPDETEQQPLDVVLNTRVHPNPSDPNKDFTYEVNASETFEGTVEILTVTGVRLHEAEINGSSKYVLSFNLRTSGMYLIRTTSSMGIVKTDKVIIK